MIDLPARLPRAADAYIARASLEGYVLNPEHQPDGKNKARIFESALDLTQANWEYLREALLEGIRYTPLMEARRTRWGIEYCVGIDVAGLNGQIHEVRSWWILPDEEAPPQLTTAFVNLP